MSLLADLATFIRDHCTHGCLTADATEPAWNGYSQQLTTDQRTI